MKRIWIAALLAFLMMQGCSSEPTETIPNITTDKEATASTSTEELSEAETVESTAGIPIETHLELAEIKDYSPVYNLAFKKIEGNTGNELAFKTAELNAEPKDSVGALIIEEPNNSDVLSFSFWNLNEVNSIMFSFDGLEYNFVVPKAEKQEIDVDQTIYYGNCNAVIKTADIYPKAIVLHILNISDEGLFKNNIFLNVGGQKVPPYDFYDDTTGKALLFVFEKEIEPKQIESIEIGNGSKYVVTAFEFQ